SPCGTDLVSSDRAIPGRQRSRSPRRTSSTASIQERKESDGGTKWCPPSLYQVAGVEVVRTLPSGPGSLATCPALLSYCAASVHRSPSRQCKDFVRFGNPVSLTFLPETRWSVSTAQSNGRRKCPSWTRKR